MPAENQPDGGSVLGVPPDGANGSSGASPGRVTRGVWVAAAVGVALRVAWVLGVARIPTGLSDPFLYRSYGIAIASGAGYESLVGDPTAYYPPGYPFLLGAVYWVAERAGVTGFPTWPVGLTQALLWGVAIVAVGRIAVILIGRSAGVVAATLLACWPNLVAYSAALLSESAFVAASALAILAATVLAGPPSDPRGSGSRRPDCRWPWLVLLGVSSAAATALRPQFVFAVAVIVVVWLVWRIPARVVVSSLAAVAVGLVLVLGPWAARNDATLGARVLWTNVGDNLCIGSYPGARGGFAIASECQSGRTWYQGIEGELAQDEFGRTAARRYVLEDPVSWVLLAPRKLFYTYLSDDDGLDGVEAYGADPVGSDVFRTTFVVVANVFYAMVGVAGLVGLGVLGRGSWRTRNAARAALVAAALATLFLPVLFFGDPRFKVAASPFIAVGAAAALTAGWSRLRARHAAG